MGVNADRLAKITTADLAQFGSDSSALRAIKKSLDECRSLLPSSTHLGFGDQTNTQIKAVHAHLTRRFRALSDVSETIAKNNDAAKDAVEQAQNAYHNLTPAELNWWETALCYTFGAYSAPSLYVPDTEAVVTGPELADMIRAEREQAREEEAARALNNLESELGIIEDRLNDGHVYGTRLPLDDMSSGSSEHEKTDSDAGLLGFGGRYGSRSDYLAHRTQEKSSGAVPLSQSGSVNFDSHAASHSMARTNSSEFTTGHGNYPGGNDAPSGSHNSHATSSIPSRDRWPFEVHVQGIPRPDGEMGGYFVPVNPTDGVAPKNPYLASLLENDIKARAAGVGGAGALGVVGAAGLARMMGTGGLSGAGGLASAGGMGTAGLAGSGPGMGTSALGTAGAAGGSSGMSGATGVAAAGGTGTTGAASSGGSGAGGRGVMGMPMSGAAGSDKDRSNKREYGQSGITFYDFNGDLVRSVAADEGTVSEINVLVQPIDEESDEW
ncbi:MAG: hypothetical protein Q4P05_08860 [Actinomycetaceae bacterium]|nr:hypothetical protein [Actinomycetaceae bacterium]